MSNFTMTVQCIGGPFDGEDIAIRNSDGVGILLLNFPEFGGAYVKVRDEMRRESGAFIAQWQTWEPRP